MKEIVEEVFWGIETTVCF